MPAALMIQVRGDPMKFRHYSWQLATTVLQSITTAGRRLLFIFLYLIPYVWETDATVACPDCSNSTNPRLPFTLLFSGCVVSKGSQCALTLFGRECCSRDEYRVQRRQFSRSFTLSQNSQRKKIKSKWIKRKGKNDVTELITVVNGCPPCVLHYAGSINGQMKN